MKLLAWAGWAGNAFFFGRFLVQWLLSERAGRSLAPRLFWWMSLCGSLALGIYTLGEEHYVLLVGYALNGLIYARNLSLQPAESTHRRQGNFLWLAVVGMLVLAAAALASLRANPERQWGWFACAGLGQAIWSTRFVVQWVASERTGESHFPRAFWRLSLAGNALLLAYTVHLGDPVLIASYLPGPLIQLRNLSLDRRGRGAARAGRSAAGGTEGCNAA